MIGEIVNRTRVLTMTTENGDVHNWTWNGETFQWEATFNGRRVPVLDEDNLAAVEHRIAILEHFPLIERSDNE